LDNEFSKTSEVNSESVNCLERSSIPALMVVELLLLLTTALFLESSSISALLANIAKQLIDVLVIVLWIIERLTQ
jgi:hypothetical protein